MPRWRTAGALVFCLLPVLFFCGALWREMRPVPIFDDYHAILYFVLRLEEQPNFPHRLAYLFAAQHDEYKLIVEHTLVAADWALSGHVHFGLLIATGNLLVFALAWVLWQNLHRGNTDLRHHLWSFAPVSYLLFQLNYVENLNWAMCSLQTLPVLVFGLLCLHGLVRKGPRALILGSLCGCLAALSSANGFLLAPIGIGIFLAQRRLRALALWAASFSVAVALYLYSYQAFRVPPIVPHPRVWQYLLFFLSFLGSAAENMHHFPLRHGSELLGVLLLAGIAATVWKRADRTHPFFFWMAIWCCFNAAVVTKVRIHQGLELSLTDRYKIYSDLLLIAAYAYWAPHIQVDAPKNWGRKAYRIVCAGTILFALVSDVFGYRFLVKRQQRVELGLNLYAAHPETQSPEISFSGEPIAGEEPAFARAVLTEALAHHIYRLPAPGKR